jgi:hypothetical protein
MTALKFKCDESKATSASTGQTELKPDPSVYIDPNSAYTFNPDNLTMNVINEADVNMDQVKKNNE